MADMRRRRDAFLSVGLVVAIALAMVMVALHQQGNRRVALGESEALRLAEGLESRGERSRIARGAVSRARAQGRSAPAAYAFDHHGLASSKKQDKLKWEVNRLLSIAHSLTGDSSQSADLQAPDVQLSQIKELNDIANDDEHPDLLGWPASDKSEGEALQLAERPSAPHRSRTSSSQKKPTGDNREALALEMAETPSAPLDATSRDLMRDTQRRVSTRAARMSQLHSESRPAKAVKRATLAHGKSHHVAMAVGARKLFKGVDDLTYGAQEAMNDVQVPASKIRRGWLGM